MAGNVNLCSAIREEATELLLLGRPLPVRAARHVTTCEGCSRELEDVRRVVRTFERADAVPVSPLLDAARHSDGKAPRAPGRLRRRVVLGAVSMAIAACAVTVTIEVTHSGRPAATVASVSVTQDGEMVSHLWGTEIPVSLSGLRSGHTYRLMTGNAHGDKVQAGSVQAGPTGAPLRVHMNTAMRKDTITTLYVQDEDGHFIARTSVGAFRAA